MLVLIDESLPKRIRREMAGFEVRTVQAFLTADQSLQYQQNLSLSKLRIIVFAAPSNRMEHLGPLLPRAISALHEMAAGEVRIITAGT